ncbi:hypothetical protein Amsp01_017930 [Amycolatopsis sp. NBRC 101858]|uniref:hypothetical protein n=1 Tax=Amycolatopsis sp. NBRC 101858 TaxID=3032200 RepID=UPI0024A318C6|nr:hypothetical protein [Amycolatopsis sp. NBRC 101858]GLY35769.1 hypothetical protein Amsp01_017930 [Amycolatopsis sp. NBRC 101858]
MSPRKSRKVPTRERAIPALFAGLDLVSVWVDEVRREAEKRVDSYETADVVPDAAYSVALRLYSDLNSAINAFIVESKKVEAGEVR